MSVSADLYRMEEELRAEGFPVVCGVDEAGRGPLAGPVYAAAVILPPGLRIPGLNDSKKLSEKKREDLFEIITSEAVSYGIASAGSEEIDELNILNAVYLAMNRAAAQLDPVPDLRLIDGNRNRGIEGVSRCVVKGDAKVSRDRLMLRMAERYPQYGFEKHKGYGTALHYEKLREFGPCEIHRRSFLKKMH